MELQWKSNLNLSAIHAAWCVAHLPQLSTQCDEPLKNAAAELDKLAGAFNVSRPRFWEQLLTLSPTVDFSVDLAKRLMSRVGLSSELQQSRLAASINECRRQFERAYPSYAADISLRIGPLRQLWEAQGPGLLHMIRRWTEDHVIVEYAEVVLVQPIVGGMGYAHLATNRVHIEALPTNAAPELPETLRLAWLLSQLDFERPVYSESINAHRLRPLVGFAMLPVVLLAGQELELCCYSPELVERAIQLWHLDCFELDATSTSHIVTSWWEAYQAARPPWRIALTGLDQML